MANKFLDASGVTHLWGKIKEKFLMIGESNLTDAQKKTTRESIGLPEYVTFNNITDLNNAPSTEVLYAFYTGPKSVTLNSVVKVSSKWHNIDFNGAMVSLGSLPSVNGTNAFEGHGQCFIRNLKVLGTWNVDKSSVNNILYTFAGVENVIIDVAMEGSHYGRGFYSCQRLNNCKCEVYGGKITSARAYYYCEYLDSCRVGSKSLSSGFNTCTNLNQCDVYQGGCVGHEVEDCKNYTNVSYYVDGVRKYFSDCDNVKVNGYNITNFANLIAEKNSGDVSKVLVHPAGGTGVSEVPLDTEATDRSVVRRLTDGAVKVWDGYYKGIACSKEYMIAYVDNASLTNLSEQRKVAVRNGLGLNFSSSAVAGGVNQLFDGDATLDVTNKNPNATALDSAITGVLNKGAQGQYASAFGGKSIALGKRSFAEGTTTIAKGNYSHAEGDNAVALGSDSHVEGYQTVTGPSALGSHAEGGYTQALGKYSHAEGLESTSNGDSSHSEGRSTIANGVNSHAEGNSSRAVGESSHAEGHTTYAIGNNSHAEGGDTSAEGSWSHAEGNGSDATGDASHSEGFGAMASGGASHAEGNNTKATESNAHAEGNTTEANGTDAHSEGYGTKANGGHSHAEGENTSAYGRAAHSEGLCTKTNNVGEHAEGTYNLSHTSSAGIQPMDQSGVATISSIGFGYSEDTRKNVIEVMGNGDIYVYGVGNYDGTKIKSEDSSVMTIQDMFTSLTNSEIDTIF